MFVYCQLHVAHSLKNWEHLTKISSFVEFFQCYPIHFFLKQFEWKFPNFRDLIFQLMIVKSVVDIGYRNYCNYFPIKSSQSSPCSLPPMCTMHWTRLDGQYWTNVKVPCIWKHLITSVFYFSEFSRPGDQKKKGAGESNKGIFKKNIAISWRIFYKKSPDLDSVFM